MWEQIEGVEVRWQPLRSGDPAPTAKPSRCRTRFWGQKAMPGVEKQLTLGKTTETTIKDEGSKIIKDDWSKI